MRQFSGKLLLAAIIISRSESLSLMAVPTSCHLAATGRAASFTSAKSSSSGCVFVSVCEYMCVFVCVFVCVESSKKRVIPEVLTSL